MTFWCPVLVLGLIPALISNSNLNDLLFLNGPKNKTWDISSYTTTNSAPTMSLSSHKDQRCTGCATKEHARGKRAKALGPGGGRRAVRGEPHSLGKGDPQIRGFLEPLSGQKRCDHLLGREIPHGSFLRGILVMLLSWHSSHLVTSLILQVSQFGQSVSLSSYSLGCCEN